MFSGVTCRANRQPSGSRSGRHVGTLRPLIPGEVRETGPLALDKLEVGT